VSYAAWVFNNNLSQKQFLPSLHREGERERERERKERFAFVKFHGLVLDCGGRRKSSSIPVLPHPTGDDG